MMFNHVFHLQCICHRKNKIHLGHGFIHAIAIGRVFINLEYQGKRKLGVLKRQLNKGVKEKAGQRVYEVKSEVEVNVSSEYSMVI
jgi:hypothetical protein